MVTVPSFCLHRSIEVHFDEIAMILYHHTYVKHFDIVLNSVGLSVVDATFRLKVFSFRGLNSDGAFRYCLSIKQVRCSYRSMDYTMITHPHTRFRGAATSVSLYRTTGPVSIFHSKTSR